MIHTRISRIEDVNKICCVLASSWKTAYRGIVHDDYLDALQSTHWANFLSTGLNDGRIFSMVIEDDQEIIGAAVLSDTEKANEANLRSFYLLPDKIGKGFGHIFYSAIEIELKSRGFSNCVIDVLENNSRAIRFYKAHGFIDTGRVINAVLGTQNYSCKELEKTLY